MNKLAAVLLIIVIPLTAIGQMRIYLLPEVELNKNDVKLGDIAKIEGEDSGKSGDLLLPKDIYQDSLIDRKEINDFLSGKISESFFIFGNGVKLVFSLPDEITIDQEKVAVIKKGQSVDLIVRKGPIIIEMTGRALKDGYENEDVEVRLKSGRIIKGKALSEGKVSAIL